MELGLLVLAVVFAAAAFYQAFVARAQADRTARMLSTIERRIIWIEQDVSERMIANGMDREDARILHDIHPPFDQMEEELRSLFRGNKNPG